MTPGFARRCGLSAALAAAAILVAAPHAWAQVTTRVSLAFDGSEANRSSEDAAISADGLHVAFESEATNLVRDDGNQLLDIFVRDLATGVTERVSVSSAEDEANDISFDARISADGRFVAFTSWASNLIPHDLNGAADVFLRDRVLGTTALISLSSTGVYGDLASRCDDLSPDGNFVVFSSTANELVPGDFQNDSDVFVRDRAQGLTERVSVNTAGVEGNFGSSAGTISADGRFVAFGSSATNLAPDTNGGGSTGFSDIFLRDRQAGTTALISVNTAGQQVNAQSVGPDISADGRYVAFMCAGHLIELGQPAGSMDVYVRDLIASTTELANLDSSGAVLDVSMMKCALSADGRYVVLDTLFGYQPTHRRDRVAGTTQLVGLGTDGTLAGSMVEQQPISEDGRFVVFDSFSSSLAADDTNEASDIFLRDTRPFFSDLGQGLAGMGGVPSLAGSGVLLGGEPVAFTLADAQPSAASTLIISPFALFVPFKGGTLVPAPTLLPSFTTSVAGTASLPVVWPATLPSDLVVYFQWWIQDPAGPAGFSASNALSATTP
jgi:Tol biopolymer transport system component